jgi:membrane associated rhomboid family serine protease
MGFENRDYTREGDYTGTIAGWGLDYLSPVVKWLIAANVIVFLVQIFATRSFTEADIQAAWDDLPPPMRAMYREWDAAERPQDRREVPPKEPATDRASAEKSPAIATDASQVPAESFKAANAGQKISIVNEWLGLQTSKVLRGQVWRLVTCSFCHDWESLFHILINMLGLFWFGVTLESMLGGREFLLFYLAGAVAASLAHMGLDIALGSDVMAVGASGAVMAVLMLYAIHYPRNTIRFFWFFPLEVRWVVMLYIIFDLHPVLLALAGNVSYYDRVAHAAHLGGLAFGFVYWKFELNLERWWDKLPKLRAPSLGSARPSGGPARRRSPERQMEDEVDAILAKISVSGEASLTDQERRTLQKASERYKRKHG